MSHKNVSLEVKNEIIYAFLNFTQWICATLRTIGMNIISSSIFCLPLSAKSLFRFAHFETVLIKIVKCFANKTWCTAPKTNEPKEKQQNIVLEQRIAFHDEIERKRTHSNVGGARENHYLTLCVRVVPIGFCVRS